MFQETEGRFGPTGPAGWGCREKEAAGREGDQWVGEHQGEAGGDCGGSPGWKRHYDAADERWRVPNGKVRKLFCIINIMKHSRNWYKLRPWRICLDWNEVLVFIWHSWYI